MIRALGPLALALGCALAGAAGASPADYPACSAGADDARALRRCDTFRTDLRECNALAVQAPTEPAACLERRLDAWSARLEAEEARAVAAGLREPGALAAWRREVQERCRDPEDIRLSAERISPEHAAFVAARCTLRATIKRLVETTARLKGFE